MPRLYRALREVALRRTRFEITDSSCPGLRLRVSPSGSRSFTFGYSFGGRLARLPIGPWPETTLALARERAAGYQATLRAGIKPVQAAKAAKEERLRAPTVRDLALDYLEHHARPFKRSWAEDDRILRVNVLPVLGDTKAAAVHRRDIVALLDPNAARAPIMANRTLALTRKLFNHAVQRGALEVSPCTHIKAPGREHARERVLNDDEIRALWTRLDTARMDPRTAAALKLVLVTGQRPGEVRAMRWEEIQDAWWTLPAAKVKNGSCITYHSPGSPWSFSASVARALYSGRGAGSATWPRPP